MLIFSDFGMLDQHQYSEKLIQSQKTLCPNEGNIKYLLFGAGVTLVIFVILLLVFIIGYYLIRWVYTFTKLCNALSALSAQSKPIPGHIEKQLTESAKNMRKHQPVS